MAFQSANSSGSGKLLAEELTEKLKQRNAAITAESVADLMNRYMTKECHVEILMDFGGGWWVPDGGYWRFFCGLVGVVKIVVYGNFAG